MGTVLTSVLAGTLVTAVATAAPATAAATCAYQTFTRIVGVTRNETRDVLTRTYLEKGVTNSWGDEPAPTVRAPGVDRWCLGTPIFGTAMKVSYRIGDTGAQVSYEAWRYGPGPVGARCSVDGAGAARFTCSTKILSASDQHLWVVFVLEPLR